MGETGRRYEIDPAQAHEPIGDVEIEQFEKLLVLKLGRELRPVPTLSEEDHHQMISSLMPHVTPEQLEKEWRDYIAEMGRGEALQTARRHYYLPGQRITLEIFGQFSVPTEFTISLRTEYGRDEFGNSYEQATTFTTHGAGKPVSMTDLIDVKSATGKPLRRGPLLKNTEASIDPYITAMADRVDAEDKTFTLARWVGIMEALESLDPDMPQILPRSEDPHGRQ